MPEPMGYRIDCPSCGGSLQAVALGPETAPWLCNECHRGFWAAELTAVARARYRVRHHDWGRGTPADAIRRSVTTEWLQAQARGCSLRPDQLEMAHKDHLESAWTLRERLAPEFADALHTEFERRG